MAKVVRARTVLAREILGDGAAAGRSRSRRRKGQEHPCGLFRAAHEDLFNSTHLRALSSVFPLFDFIFIMFSIAPLTFSTQF